jgi:hypothetical protein
MSEECRHGLPPCICAICIEERGRAELEALVRLTGKKKEEIEKDLTAPDPREGVPHD